MSRMTRYFGTTFAAALAVIALAFVSGCDEPDTQALIGPDGVEPSASEHVNEVTPSTNEENKALGWAYVQEIEEEADIRRITLEFVSERNFLSCFEYRIDGEPPEWDDNPNSDIEDGLWAFECVSNEEQRVTLEADHQVDVRMVFGAERDERFDWTPFDVAGVEACHDGGHADYGFRNQGQCIRFAKTGFDGRD